MAVSFSTPYYLSGKQARQWHTNKGEKATMAAGTLGLVSYGLTKPKYQGMASSVLRSTTGANIDHPDMGVLSHPVAIGAGAVGAYGAYHFGRAAVKNRQLKQRNKKSGGKYQERDLKGIFDHARASQGNVS